MSRVREGSHNIVTVDFELRFSKTDTGKVSRKTPNALLTIQNRKYRLNEFNMPAPIFRTQMGKKQEHIPTSSAVADYTDPGKAMSADTYNNIIEHACLVAGYPVKFASHDLRVLAIQSALSVSCKYI